MSGEVNLCHHSEDILDSRAFNFGANSESSAQSLKVQKIKCIDLQLTFFKLSAR